MIKVVTEKLNSNLKFSFEKYCAHILAVIPNEDKTGLYELRIVENFSQLKPSDNALACYLQGKGNNASIEINIVNLIRYKAPDYLFKAYFEIAALILSGVIAHEIGHHVHTFKRHGIKKSSREIFSGKYSEAGYFCYLQSRYSKILSEYRRASFDFIRFDKNGRKSFSYNRKELIKWLNNNEKGIAFP